MTKIIAKSLASTIGITGALGFAALGLGAGMANATSVSPGTDLPWMEKPHDHDHDHGRWRGPKWDDDWVDFRGPGGLPGGGCVTATDPAGLVTGTWCV